MSMYFNRKEFQCKCGCGFDTVDYELMEVLTELREHFGKPILVNSGCRCAEHNKNEGGGEYSQHLYGRAADVVVKDIHADVVAEYLENKYVGKYGIGRYVGRTHVDTRNGGPARWDTRG